MDVKTDARNLRKSKLLPELIARFRQTQVERLLSTSTSDLGAQRAAVLAIDEFSELLNDVLNEHVKGSDEGPESPVAA